MCAVSDSTRHGLAYTRQAAPKGRMALPTHIRFGVAGRLLQGGVRRSGENDRRIGAWKTGLKNTGSKPA